MVETLSGNLCSPSLESTLHYHLVRNVLRFGWFGCIAMALANLFLVPDDWFWKVSVSGVLAALFALLNFVVFNKIRTLKQLDILSILVLVPCYVSCAVGVFTDPAHQVTSSYVLISASGAMMICRGFAYWSLLVASIGFYFACSWSVGHATTKLDYIFLFVLIPWMSLIFRSIVNSNYKNLLAIYQEREELVEELSATVKKLKAQTTKSERAKKESQVIEAEHLRVVQQRQSYERQILHSQKLENLGLLAGGVAHDFNNYLAAIISFSESLLDSADQNSKEILEQIKQTAFKAAGVADRMLAQTGKPSEWGAEFEVIDLNRMLEEMKPFLRALAPKTIEFELETSLGQVWIKGDELAIQQLVMNLLKNAADATSSVEHGRISIFVTEEYSRERPTPRFSIGDLEAESRFCQIEILDNGTGISEEDIKRIFDPQFTTKPEGHGFGMAIANRIILDHGGSIEIDNNIPRGTCVRIVIPRVPAPKDHVVDQPELVPIDLSQGLVVLLVDDERSVLESVAMLLEAKGHKVIAVPGAEDALLEMEVHYEEIDCLILDFSMPKTNGLELLNRIRSRGWSHPAILCSGFIMSLDDHPNAQFWPDEFLAKPYKFNQLQEAMEKICRNKLGHVS